MATDPTIEQFICDSFTSIWELELLSVMLDRKGMAVTAAELVETMRASELVVEKGISTLVAIGLAETDAEGRLIFHPVNSDLEDCARRASEFYRRFPGRARRLMIGQKAPGLTAFADAFRLRRE